jgi:hypothetical protein
MLVDERSVGGEGSVPVASTTLLPLLTDVTPDAVAGLLDAVSGAVALSDPALQLAALTALGDLLPVAPSNHEDQDACMAAGACTEWVCAAAAAHAGRADVVQRALFVLRRISWAAEDPRPLLGPVHPVVQAALTAHADVPALVEEGLACLRNLAFDVGNAEALMASVPAVRAVLAAHAGVPSLVQRGLSLLSNLAAHESNAVPLMAVVPLVRAAMAAHAGARGVVVSGLQVLSNLSADAENAVPLLAEVPTLRAALATHADVEAVVEQALQCLSNLAAHDDNAVALMAEVPSVCACARSHGPHVALLCLQFLYGVSCNTGLCAQLRAAGVAALAADFVAFHPLAESVAERLS